MTQSIPASYYVPVTPSVVPASGNALVLNCLLLTESTRSPIGAVLGFPSADAVAAYYGDSSLEAQIAAVQFLGFDNSDVKPSSMLITQFNPAAVAGWMRGGSTKSLTLAALKALTGTLSVVVDGTTETSAAINLTAATSFSNACTIILAAFTTPTFGVTFDSVSSAFVFTSNTTGASSSVSVASGTLAAGLFLTTQTGAIVSPGAIAAVPGTFMAGVKAATQNWVTFMTAFDPDGGSGNAEKLAFAAWTNTQNNRYVYVCWDTDLTPTESLEATSSLGYLLTASGSNGTCPIYSPSWLIAAFVCGSVASIDFTRKGARVNFAWLSQAGLSPEVTDETTAANLEANGYNYYGITAAANQSVDLFFPGSVTGQFDFLDSLVNEIWMNNSFQLDMLTFMKVARSVPYNQAGRTRIEEAVMPTVNAAGNFGVFSAGVTLTAAQIAQVNAQAGVAIDSTLFARGWYLQVSDAPGTTRRLRQSPPFTFWYVDGESVNRLAMNSVAVQ